jgi:hypothetical protein
MTLNSLFIHTDADFPIVGGLHLVGSAQTQSQSASSHTIVSILLCAHVRSSHAAACRGFLPASHAAFAPLLSAYVRSSLRKGVPSLFADLQVTRFDPLYSLL